MSTLVHVHATSAPVSSKSLGNVHTAATASHAKLPGACPKFLARCLTANASTWVSLNITLRRGCKNILGKLQSLIINLYCCVPIHPEIFAPIPAPSQSSVATRLMLCQLSLAHERPQQQKSHPLAIGPGSTPYDRGLRIT